jgi:Zn-dependent metalloprotease
MYSKDEASQIKQAFWTTFGQYISPQLSADGLKVNWVNYKTGIKYLYFKMDADKNSATIGITITHPDSVIQELFFEQFREIKMMLNSYLNEEWQWALHNKDENGKTISRIYKQISGVSIYNRNDWPQLISFFKPRIIALDEFWSVGQYSFEALK